MDACRNLRITAHKARALALLGCAAWAMSALAEEPAGEIRLPAWVDPDSAPVAPAVQQASLEAAPRPKANPLLRAFTPPLSSPREPQSLVEPSLRLVRQLEHAASDATTHHQLSRLIRRCEAVRGAITHHHPGGRHDAEIIALLDRTDRVLGWGYAARGRLITAQRRDSRAVADLREAVRLMPTSEAVWHDLALVLVEVGEGDEALYAFNRTLELNPRSVEARRNRAVMLLQQNEAEAAIIDCDLALEGAPAASVDRAQTLLIRGLAFQAVGRLRDAAADLNESLRLAPGNPEGFTARGHVFAEGGFFEQAIEDYSSALSADPRCSEAYRSLAWLLATCPDPKLRNPETAIEAAWRARRLVGQDDFLTLDASAAAHASAGEFVEAVRLQQRAIIAAGEVVSPDAVVRLRSYQRRQAYVAPRLAAR